MSRMRGENWRPEEIEQGEDQLGVAGGVGGVLGDRQVGLVVENLVEHVGGVADGRHDHLAAVLRVLVARPGVEGDTPAVAEVAG